LENVNKMSKINLKQSKSEVKILQSRGYRLIRKLGQGSYAKVCTFSALSKSTCNHWRFTFRCTWVNTKQKTHQNQSHVK
jgi:hypothetical protein